MIVVDVNVLAYLLIPGQHTASAEKLFQADPQWVAPRLWRSEFRNVLATYLRSDLISLADASALFQQAALIIGAEEYEVETLDVLRLSKDSGCSAYDCEYIALAEFLDLTFVTADKKLQKAFPQRTTPLSDA
jgi:predicted nucleic acid-binding protein